MKKILLFLSMSFVVLSTSIFSINIAKAEQGVCSLSDPCDNWASVDSSGVVTNVIVCQVSVCGRDGSWGAIDPNNGNRLVPQTAGNASTGDTLGTSGYIGNPDGSSVVIENNGVFTIIEGETKTAIESGIELTTVVSETRRTFTFGSSIGKLYNEIPMEIIAPSQNTIATISAKNQTENNLILETKTFLERKTSEEIEEKLQSDGLNLMLSKIQTFLSMLGSWIK
jgi:hypothetical protein